MKDWFANLEQREQRFVIAGGIAVLIAILYLGIWAPLDRGHTALKADVNTWQESLTDLKLLRPRLAAGNNQPGQPASNGQTPIVIVDQTLRSRGLDQYRTRSQPVSNNGIRVEFENVAFDDLVLWLGDVSSQHGMHVQAGTFSGGNQTGTGRINATLTLERVL